MASKRNWLFLIIGLVLCPTSMPQYNNRYENVNNQFYLDSSTDCNGPVRNVFSTRTVIKGKGADQSSSGPTSCTISLKTEKPFEVSSFKIDITALNIQDCSVQFSIYDGEAGQTIMDAFDCNKGMENNMRDLVTTGDKVTFVLQRQDIRNTLYDIELTAIPIVAGRDPSTGDGDGGYTYHRKFPTEVIVGIIGGLFLVVVIVIVILSVHCYRKHKGMTKKWEQQPLSNVVTNSAYAGSDISKSKYSDSTSVWASEVSRNHDYKNPHRSRRREGSEYSESQFSDDMSLPPKRSYAPSTRSGRTDRTGRSHNTLPPSYDRAARPSFEDFEENRMNEMPVEREIPVRTRRNRINTAVSTTTSVGVDPIDEDNLGDDEKLESELEEEEEEEEEVTEEEEEEEESEDEAHQEPPTTQASRPSVAATPNPVQSHPSQPMQQIDPRASAQGMMPQQYPAYMPQQQFIPVPYQMPPGYPPPQYPGQVPGHGPAPQEPIRVPSVKPTDPPIYSYLVQRGYTPLDGRRSPSVASGASHSSTGRLLKEDSDSGNLESGVEFMRR